MGKSRKRFRRRAVELGVESEGANAQAAAARGSRAAAINQMNAFINQVQAMERSRRISTTLAAQLIAEAQQIIAGL